MRPRHEHGNDEAKSPLEVKDGHTFLDVIVRQLLHLRERHAAPIPLLLMDSFATRDDTLAALEPYAELAVDDLPLDFVQGRVPSSWPTATTRSAGPTTRRSSGAAGPRRRVRLARATGLLAKLLEAGYRYLFISNADNLGAALDPRIAGWFAAEGLPFVTEVVDRTEGDKKGGHLRPPARQRRVALRETAQVLDEDQEASRTSPSTASTPTASRSTESLERTLEQGGGASSCDDRQPQDRGPPTVLAGGDPAGDGMGAAVGIFEGAGAVHAEVALVPVKKMNDLLVVRRTPIGRARTGPSGWRRSAADRRRTWLDPDHYKLVADFERHFPGGPPSLRAASGSRSRARSTSAATWSFGAGCG